jgi:hypothetical protein
LTTISAQTAYNAVALYGQNAPRNSVTSDSANSQANTSAPSASSTSISASAASPSDIIAAAQAAAANSASYSFSTVAQNARTVLDAGEQQYGKQPNMYTTGSQWQQIFGGMDRRSLYAVASNQGGQFSTQEQQTASFFMNKQLSDVVGNVGSMPNENDQMNAFGNYISFLNNVSPEEKQSPEWAMGMASGKTSYNDLASDLGQPQQTYDGTNPLITVLMSAMKAAQYDPSKDITTAGGDSLSSILSNPWAKGFEPQIQAAYAAAIPNGSSVNVQA